MAPSVHTLLVLTPRHGQRSPSPSPCGKRSDRLRRGVTSLFRRLRPSRQDSHGTPEPMDESPTGTPTSAIDRYMAARAAAVFEGVDDAQLLNYRGAWLMQLAGLEELNDRDQAVMEALLKDPTGPEAMQAEMELLTADLDARHRNVAMLQLSLQLVETELARRGAPLTKSESEIGVLDLPDDATLCQYCVSQPANTDFLCCHHTGACADCAAVMLQAHGRCPHCRAPDPAVHRLPVGSAL
eukprot:EG_transcript_3389